MSSVTPFLSEPLDFEIRDGVMHVSKGDWSMATPLPTFRINMRRAQKVIDAHDQRRAEVVPMRRGRKDAG